MPFCGITETSSDAERVEVVHSDKENVAAAALFYQYLSEKRESFLTEHDFSKEEVLDGMNRLVQKAGYGDLLNIVEGLQVI